MKQQIITSKKSTVKNNHYRNGNVDLPEVINMDSLSYFDDDGLDRLHSQLQAERERASTFDLDTQPWEVEICYVQREIKIRNSRRAAHERYMKSNPDAYSDNVVFE